MFAPDDTVCACASALPGHSAVLRLSGSAACAVAEAAGLPLPPAWAVVEVEWDVLADGGGRCPCRALYAPAGRSFTGYDLIEVVVPGSPDLVELCLERLCAAGAARAGAGAFTRQALASGRLALDQAEAILAVAQAADVD
ncbi:MAG: hypothetical protein ACYTF0_07490, partial [Planctomycetota bacterium]